MRLRQTIKLSLLHHTLEIGLSFLSFVQVGAIPTIGKQTEKTENACGGLIESPSGYISFKPIAPGYENNEKCIWIIKSNKASTLFRIVRENFEPEYDFLSIYTVNSEGGLVRSKKITHGFNQLAEALGSLSILVFTSDRSSTGLGFELEFFGFGPSDQVGMNNYTNLYSSERIGEIQFPDNDHSSSKSLQTYENLLLCIIPKPGRSLVVMTQYVDILKLASTGCAHNYYSIHELFYDGFKLRLRDCVSTVEGHTTTVSFSSPIIITYKALNTLQRKGIKLSWTEGDLVY